MRDRLVIAAFSAGVERVHPAAIVENDPERVLVEPAQIRHQRRQDMRHPFIVEGTGEMMVVGDVGARFGPEHHRDHVLAQKGAGPVIALLAPLLPLARTSSIPTVICVGRNASIGTGVRMGSRTMGASATSPAGAAGL